MIILPLFVVVMVFALLLDGLPEAWVILVPANEYSSNRCPCIHQGFDIACHSPQGPGETFWSVVRATET